MSSKNSLTFTSLDQLSAMKVYEFNSTYFLVDWKKSPHTVIVFSADQPIPHVCPIGASLLSEEFLAKATLRIDESLFLGCLLFQSACVYYFYGAEVQTLSFRLPKQLERMIPKQLFKETEILAFFKALRAQNCLSTCVHPSSSPTLLELTFYGMFGKTDAETLQKVGVVTRFSIGHNYEHIYMRRDWTSGPKEKKLSILYYISCNLGNERSLLGHASSTQQLPLITTNYNENLIEKGDPSIDSFVEQLSTILAGRSQRIRRLYFVTKEHCEALGPALSKHGLTPVLDREQAELKVEFAMHPFMLSLTTDYQLLLDALMEQISAFGNAKEKRLNRVLTAASVEDLAERLLLQLDTYDMKSLYLANTPKPSSDRQSPCQFKILSYVQKLMSVLSLMMHPIPFAPFDEASLGVDGRSIYFQSDTPISSTKQIIIHCTHISLCTVASQSSEMIDQTPLYTIPSIKVFVGSKKCPDKYYEIYKSHQIRLYMPALDTNAKRGSIIQDSNQDGTPHEYLFFSMVCVVSWGDSLALGGIKTPFNFDLVRVDQQEDSQFIISYIVVPGSGIDTGLSLCSTQSIITETAVNNNCHVVIIHQAFDAIIASLVADTVKSKHNGQIQMSNSYAVARYMSGDSAVPTTLAALIALLMNQEQDVTTVSQPLLMSIYQRAQQLMGATKSRKKGSSNKSTYIKVMTDPRCNFAFTHGLLSILRAEKHEQKACISLLMIIPNPMILEIIRLFILYIPTLLETSNELKVILGATGYDRLYKSSSYFSDTYIKLSSFMYKLASSAFLSGFVRAEENTLFNILSPQVRVKDNLYARLRPTSFTHNMSLGEVADKFEQVLLEFLQEESTNAENNFIGLSCSNCEKSITKKAKGEQCAKCHLLFCESCSSLRNQVFYSSYEFKTPVPLCPECAGEESLLEPIYKILVDDKTMTESERAQALLTIFDHDLANKLKGSEDKKFTPTLLPDKDLTKLAVLSSFCENVCHKFAMPVAMRVAGADGQFHLQTGCVCTHIPQSESSAGINSLADCCQQTRLLVKPINLLQTLYLAIPSSLFSEMEKEPSIVIESEKTYTCKEIATLLVGIRIFQYVLDPSSESLKYSFKLNIPTSDYYIIGFASSVKLPQEKAPMKISSYVSLPYSTPSMQYTHFGLKPGLNLLECEAKLTPGMLSNQRLAKCADSTIFLSIAYPHRSIIKLSATKSDVIVTFRYPTARVQRSMSSHMIVYHVACLSDNPLDREKRKAREGLVRQASDGIITAVQVFSLPFLNVVNKQEITYQLLLNLRSTKSTMRLLFASTEEHTITEISEAF